MSRCVVVFTKAPVLGAVKTRLQPEFTPAQSLFVHRALVRHTLAMTALVAYPAELWVGSRHDWWLQLENDYGVAIFQQQGDDLGDRMAYAVRDARRRAAAVVIIGTDCPYLTPDYLASAFALLETTDVVIGPAEDGGYVLLGLGGGLARQDRAGIFSHVNWGSEQVLEQTRGNLQRLGLSWKELPVLADIDRPEDLRRLLGAGDGPAAGSRAGVTLASIEACLASLSPQ